MAAPCDFTRQDVNFAINAALGKVTDERWVRAIYKASSHLSSGQFAFDGRYVILHSASSDGRYVLDSNEPVKCSCRAHERGLICWHVTAARLIKRAAEHHAAQRAVVNPLDESKFAKLTAEMDELFAA